VASATLEVTSTLASETQNTLTDEQPREKATARTVSPVQTLWPISHSRPACKAPTFAKDPDKAGGVTTEEDGALAPLEAPDGAASTPVPKTEGASTRAPCTPVEAKRSHDKLPWKKPLEGMRGVPSPTKVRLKRAASTASTPT
jgi:hypothetical protein